MATEINTLKEALALDEDASIDKVSLRVKCISAPDQDSLFKIIDAEQTKVSTQNLYCPISPSCSQCTCLFHHKI